MRKTNIVITKQIKLKNDKFLYIFKHENDKSGFILNLLSTNHFLFTFHFKIESERYDQSRSI